MLWLAIHLPALSLAVHTRARRPQQEAAPPLAVVLEGRVLAASREAMAEGVGAGQSTASALALCLTLRFLEHQPDAEARLLRQIAEACFALTPTVVLAPPQAILLEVGGCLDLFRGHAGLLRQLERRLRPFRVGHVLAQATTPGAALLLAQSPLAGASLQLPLPLTMAACLPLLRQVAVERLPWAPEAGRKLQALQLRTVGELLDLPRASLSKRLGVAATDSLARLLGERPDPRQPLRAAEDFEASLYFLDGVSEAAGLRFPMKRLLDDFCRFLRQRQWACARFQWRFGHQDKSRQQLLIASARGEPQAARFLMLSELQLENFRIGAPVESLTLSAHEFQPQADTRLSLLPDPGQEDEKALELLDRLQARLGKEACRRVSPRNNLRPEREQALAATFTATPVPAPGQAQRPFWLWPEARALRLVAGQPWWQGAFTLVSGPERIELPWWEDGDRRDYWLARHDNGAHYWLYFSARAQGWFCQGLFG